MKIGPIITWLRMMAGPICFWAETSFLCPSGANSQAHSAPPKLLRAGIPISSPPPPASHFPSVPPIPLHSPLLPFSPQSDPLHFRRRRRRLARQEPTPNPQGASPVHQSPIANASEEARRLKEAAVIAAVAARQVRHPPLLRAPDPGLPERQAPEARPASASASTATSSSAAARGGAVGCVAGGHQGAGAEAGQVFSRNGEYQPPTCDSSDLVLVSCGSVDSRNAWPDEFVPRFS
jgi:hypothetical protein